MSSEDIILWADGTWCYREDLPSMSWMSDDYEILLFDSERWHEVNPD